MFALCLSGQDVDGETLTSERYVSALSEPFGWLKYQYQPIDGRNNILPHGYLKS
jgi:hypothetical protein